MKNIIPAQSGIGFILQKNQILKVTDIEGEQVSDLFCFDKNDFNNALSSGRSIDYNDTIYLTTGHYLYSNRSDVMLEITADTCGRHDFLLTPCSLKMFQIVNLTTHHHASCLENLARVFENHKISSDQITTTFNIFMNVDVLSSGAIKIDPPRSVAGSSISFRAKMDLVVGLTACAHEQTNHGRCKPIEFEIF